MRLVWLDEARNDLIEIRRHIARDAPSAAHRVGHRIHSAVRRLLVMPEIGRPGRWFGTRELVVTGTPYVVPDRIGGDRIDILRVLHGARLWPDAPPGDTGSPDPSRSS